MFKITIKWDMEQTLKMVKAQVQEQGWSFYHNDHNWKIEVKWVEIEYKVSWNEVMVDILDKPWLVSESYIEEKVREFFLKINLTASNNSIELLHK